jgi:hypothetical protein
LGAFVLLGLIQNLQDFVSETFLFMMNKWG